MEHAKLRRYLLGQLHEDEASVVEDRLFAGDGVELAEAVEDELYDEFANGSLTGEDRAAWTRYMEAHPESASRLRMSRVLQARLVQRKGSSRWWIGALAAAAALLVAWVVLRSTDRQVFYASASLEPGTLRSGGAGVQWLDLPGEATSAQIELRRAPAEAKQALVRFVDSGQIVWRGAVENGTAVVPAGALVNGDHVLTVATGSGEELADYSFRVRRGP